MKNPVTHFLVALLTAVAYLSAVYALTAEASEPVVCTLTTGTGAATSTTGGCTTGSVTWARGSAVLVQCTTDTYISSSTTVFGGTVTAATSSSEFLDFTNNKDKVMVLLDKNDLHISVLAVTTAGTCKFMVTPRKKPTF